jgi:Zn-finger protein
LEFCLDCESPISTTQPAKVWFCHNCNKILRSDQLFRLLNELNICRKNIENIKTELLNRKFVIAL